MKLDYYSALDRLFPYWTAASSLQNANLPCRRLVRFWVLSPEDYKEPEEAFKKVSWDEVGFVDYFPNKSTLAQIGYSEWWGSGFQSSHVLFSVTFSRFFVLVLILCFLSVPFFSLFLYFFNIFGKVCFVSLITKEKRIPEFPCAVCTRKRNWQNHTKFVRASLLLLSMGNCKKSPQCNLTVT